MVFELEKPKYDENSLLERLKGKEVRISYFDNRSELGMLDDFDKGHVYLKNRLVSENLNFGLGFLERVKYVESIKPIPRMKLTVDEVSSGFTKQFAEFMNYKSYSSIKNLNLADKLFEGYLLPDEEMKRMIDENNPNNITSKNK